MSITRFCLATLSVRRRLRRGLIGMFRGGGAGLTVGHSSGRPASRAGLKKLGMLADEPGALTHKHASKLRFIGRKI